MLPLFVADPTATSLPSLCRMMAVAPEDPALPTGVTAMPVELNVGSRSPGAPVATPLARSAVASTRPVGTYRADGVSVGTAPTNRTARRRSTGHVICALRWRNPA